MGLTEHSNNLVSPSNDIINDYLIVLMVFKTSFILVEHYFEIEGVIDDSVELNGIELVLGGWKFD